MKRLLCLFLLCMGVLHGEDLVKPRTRADNIPVSHLTDMSNDYMTGYVQSLVDMHYYEFQVRVLVINDEVYVFNLPRNELISHSIICFIYGIPCISYVEAVDCCPEEFLCRFNCKTAECFRNTGAYQSICCPVDQCCQIRAIWFPHNTVLFLPLIADPRQVMNAASLRFNDNVIGKHVGAASFGGDFMIIRLKDILWWCGDMDLGLQAGIFAVFDLDHPQACHVNTDFFVALMMTYAINKWSWRTRLWHLSSHLGDEFLLANPGFPRRNLSDEGVDLFASYQLNHAVRLYAGIGYIIDRDKEFPEHPFYFEWGTEIRVFGGRDCFNKLYTQPFLAMHFRTWEEHDYDIDQTYALGVEWSKIQGVGRKFRIFFEFHDGYSKEGQFVRQRSNYFAVKVNYGF